MKVNQKAQYLNYLAIELLERLGNTKPSQQQIDLMESLISQVVIDRRLSFDHRLSEREISCLLLTAKGKSTKAIAQLLGIKSSTVRTHREGILRKLSCNNMAAAVFEGIRYGYIQSK